MVKNKQRKKVAIKLVPKPKRGKKQVKSTEVTALGRALRSLGGFAGGVAGGYLGHPALGRGVGTNLGATLSRWIGSGDYTVKANSLVRANAADSVPMMHKASQSVIVRHREFLGDIAGSTDFTVQRTITLNPGLTSSFPWLSAIAQNFQEYTVKGMVFHYVPTAGDAVSSTNNALGSVVISTHYRSTAAPPTSKLEQLNEYFSNDARPSETFCHPIECDPKENPYNVQYIRNTAVPATEDPKSYDLGVTYVTTAGMQAAGITVGELWCTYEVELRKPIVTALTGADMPVYLATSPSILKSGTALAAGLTPVRSTLAATLSGTATSFTVSLPAGLAGNYCVILMGVNNNASAQTWTSTTFTNGTNAFGGALTGANNVVGTIGAGWWITITYTITNPSLPSSATFTTAAWNSDTYGFKLLVTQVGY